MADYGRIDTTDPILQIGVGGTGVRTLRFRNANTADLTWNPTANRSISLPDGDGALMLADASNLVPSINFQTGTSYLLQATDRGRPIEILNANPITVTLPNNLPVGFTATIYQGGAGQITLSPASGALLRHRQSHTKTAGQWAAISLLVRSNSGGSAAEYVIWGDTAA